MDRISSSYEEYIQLLRNQLEHLGRTVLELQSYNQRKQANEQAKKVRSRTIWREGLLVYLIPPTNSSLSTNSKKIRMQFVGPLLIREMLDATHCVLEDLQGKVLYGVFNVNCLKPGWIRTQGGDTNSAEELRRKMLNKDTQSKENVFQFTDELGQTPPFQRNYFIINGTTTPVDKA